MDKGTLILEYVRVLTWPMVASVGMVLFRVHIGALLQRINGAELPGGFSLSFGEEVRRAEALSQEVAQEQRKDPENARPVLPITDANSRMLSLGMEPSPSGLRIDRYLELADEDPNLALAGLRMELDILGRNLAKGWKIRTTSRESTTRLLGRLKKEGAKTGRQYDLAANILRLCNRAVHGERVSRRDAEAIIDSARVLADDFIAWLSWGFNDGWSPQERSNS